MLSQVSTECGKWVVHGFTDIVNRGAISWKNYVLCWRRDSEFDAIIHYIHYPIMISDQPWPHALLGAVTWR